MRKTGTLNTELISMISAIGHTQYIVVADAGLPIPKGVKSIDLALKPGTPSFCETLEVILEEMVIEKCFLAKEIITQNPTLDEKISEKIDKSECTYITHEQLKEMSQKAMAIVRTGETSSYANIILVAGVNF